MCTRHTVTVNAKEIVKAYNLRDAEPFEPNYNVAITQATPVITSANPDIAQNFHFGLVAWYSKEPKLKSDTWNARNDRLLESNLWRPLIEKNKTCLILTTGFVEFKEISKKTGDKDPYLLQVVGRTIYAIAGLYEVWHNKQTNEIYNSYSMVTTSSNPKMSEIHWTKLRQPYILHKEQEKIWLSGDISPAEKVAMIDIFPEEQMVALPLSRAINKVSTQKAPNNNSHLLDPLNRDANLGGTLFG